MVALTAYNIANYLMNRGLISGNDFDDKWTFIENPFSQSLNTTIAAFHSSEEKQSYFIKQPRAFLPHIDNLQVEDDVISIVKHTTAKDLVPDLIYITDSESRDNPLGVKKRRVKYDSANRVFIVKFINGGLPFLSYLTSFNRWDSIEKRVNASRDMGISLAKLHAGTAKEDIVEIRNKRINVDPGISKIEKFKPWLLAATGREISRLNGSENLYIERLGDFLHGNRELFKELSDEWDRHKKLHLINIDSKLANVIVDRKNHFVFVDWEYSGFAPCLWQVGGFVANFLSTLAEENPMLSRTEVWANIEFFLMGYFNRDAIPFDKDIETILRYAGVTLLQQFYNWATSDFPSGDSGNPDKLIIGNACLCKPETVWNKKDIPGLYFPEL